MSKINVESGNPYRDQSGHFGTSPDQKLIDSFKALQGKKFVPKDGSGNKDGQSNSAIVIAKIKEAQAELAALRANSNYDLPDPANVQGFDVTKLTDNQKSMILRRNEKLNSTQTYGEYFEKAKGQKGDIYMLTPNEYRRALVESGQYKSMSDIDRRTDMSKVDKYAQDMKNGDKFDTPSIIYDRDGSTDQEGLHRAYAAREIGITHIPVAITYSVDNKPEYLNQFDNRILDITSLNKKQIQYPAFFTQYDRNLNKDDVQAIKDGATIKPTDEQTNALTAYTDYSSGDINQSLAEGKNPKDPSILQHLDDAIGQATLSKDVELYHGGELSQEQLDALKEGSSFTNKGYMSTSLNAHTAFEEFSKNVLFTYHASEGDNALYIDASMEHNKNEEEMLLPRGKDFTVIYKVEKEINGKKITIVGLE